MIRMLLHPFKAYRVIEAARLYRRYRQVSRMAALNAGQGLVFAIEEFDR